MEETAKPVIVDPGDIIVKVTASSICGSDIHFITGEVPLEPDFIIGHEGVGVVEEVALAIPSMLSMFFQNLYAVIDTLFISWLGTVPLAAQALSIPVFYVALSLEKGCSLAPRP